MTLQLVAAMAGCAYTTGGSFSLVRLQLVAAIQLNALTTGGS